MVSFQIENAEPMKKELEAETSFFFQPVLPANPVSSEAQAKSSVQLESDLSIRRSSDFSVLRTASQISSIEREPPM
jgi:hypothetical protein